MRIDQNLSALLAQESKAAEKTGTKQVQSSNSSAAEIGSDGVFATLTAASGDISQARSQRVQALQDAVTSGSYKVEPEKVASSILAAQLF